MITVLQDQNKTEYYGLMSDFLIQRIYPAHNLNKIMKLYKDKTQDNKVLLKALSILREEYYVQNAPKSKVAKKIAAAEEAKGEGSETGEKGAEKDKKKKKGESAKKEKADVAKAKA